MPHLQNYMCPCDLNKPEKQQELHQHSIYDIDDVLPTVLPIYKELEQIDLQVHHWEIKDWSTLDQRTHGPIFEVGGHKWRILLFPKGNGQHEMMSIYLEVVPEEGLEKDWSICGQFAIVLIIVFVVKKSIGGSQDIIL
ncbi:hypothetical protein RO3G_03306 [Rhizopus delemar RA 99-880]|uniref:MATH domain-containing protein n=1 Tax=Rhizopus delemar (strain RA 99-880 / ATCC MYA-4621 / FGSC 9543 / NRRL 43880) TaxID=246409 RepID=I1BQX2_RHIO9|nr:hypothetical protein RO3G_03306 [Rhizopus delemar RA 99-880]|eukprot:EIE78602.1 hypothetical protein RO3G_03306 [Rhizopus delemar RA 99-880]